MVRLTTLKSRLAVLPGSVPVLAAGSWRSSTASSTKRGYGYAWQKARVGYLRSHPFCVYCLRDPLYAAIRGMVPSTAILHCADVGLAVPMASVVDHIEPHRGDQALFWNKANWQSLCGTHHSADKQREEAAQRRGE
ncbi:MAG: HNH endonuclease [Janthinobacterium svalbardensis]|uniref:HNH endonuclease n=1 Tax=Janthinobacterium svalbardensis TaxID=368607 RepID=A0A290X0M0_9BURK|nr:HNH endonuclease [Janthinobacterium svalbardensis]ATD62508.1 HNH endonuclease [Janthinobacterium svalbardensis]